MWNKNIEYAKTVDIAMQTMNLNQEIYDIMLLKTIKIYFNEM